MRTAGLAVLLAAALGGCAAGEAARSPLSWQVPDEPRPEGLCGSLVYGFTCVPPRGWDLAEERPGPGLIMRYSSREGTPAERSHLILRAYPLGRRKLTWVLDENVLKPLRAAGAQVQERPAELGGRRGLAAAAKRSGETWAYTQLFFAFMERDTVFVAEHAVPATRAKGERRVLESFVESVAFR